MAGPGGTDRRLCEVWWAVSTLRDADVRLLDDTEAARLSALRRPADRARFTTAAALLRRAAAAAAGVEPATVKVDRTCPDCGRPHGRPLLPGLDLYASVSHSGDRVAVATTHLGPLGVDVEEIAEVDTHGLGRLVLGSGERVETQRDFYVYWVRKESAVKATGDGLRVPLASVSVSPPGHPAELVSYPGNASLASTMVDLEPGAGYVAALTVLSDRAPEVVQRWADGTGTTHPHRSDPRRSRPW